MKHVQMRDMLGLWKNLFEQLPDAVKIDKKQGLDIQLCKFIHKPLNITLNSIVKFYQKVSHSFIPIGTGHPIV